jgi:hypothetical protein
MPHRWLSVHLTGAALLMAAPTARAQCDSIRGAPIEVAGRVLDARTLAPVQAMIVFTRGADTLARSDADSDGVYFARLCTMNGVVAHFRRLGYRVDSLTVAADSMSWATLDVAMAPLRAAAVTTLAATRVTAPHTMSAVETRASRAGGIYIGPAEIERVKPTRLSDLLRGRRGVSFDDDNGTLRITSARGARPNISDGGARVMPRPTAATRDTTAAASDAEPTHTLNGGVESCALRIGVNGKLMPEDFVLDEVPAVEVVAVELYAGPASMPVEFSSTRRGVNCGMVMIWTRAAMGGP